MLCIQSTLQVSAMLGHHVIWIVPGETCRALVRTGTSPQTSSECTNISPSNPNNEPYFFDRRWRACKCAFATNQLRASNGKEANEAIRSISKGNHNDAERRNLLTHYHHHQSASLLKNIPYPSQYYPDLFPLEMCYLVREKRRRRGEEEEDGLKHVDTSHFMNNAMDLRDLELLLMQGKLIWN